jgi:hypothetical protein
MDELEEIIYIHILNQTLIDNSILISHCGLAETYQVPEVEVQRIINGLIDNGYLLKLGKGHYTVKFDRLEQIK